MQVWTRTSTVLDSSRTRPSCVLITDLPYDSGVCYSHDGESEGQVPAVTHGDEHCVVVIRLIPLHLTGWVQHKGNLGKRRAEGYTATTATTRTTIIRDGTGSFWRRKKIFLQCQLYFASLMDSKADEKQLERSVCQTCSTVRRSQWEEGWKGSGWAPAGDL